MKKIISFSLFGARDNNLENYVFNFYLRGLYWNVRMANLIYKDWQCHVELDSPTFSDYDNIFTGLHDYYGMSYNINPVQPLCKSMLWRLKPIFFDGVETVLCRDTDALVSYREAAIVQEWLKSPFQIGAIRDNPAHTVPLMGGMIGLRCGKLRDKYKDWDNLLSKSPITISERGTDQEFLMKVVYPDFKEDIADLIYPARNHGLILNNVRPELWESDLCSAFIGAAGVNELETLRFFRRFDEITPFETIAKKYPKIFYWYQ